MLKVPLLVPDNATASGLYDMRQVLGTMVELEDYVICGLITPAGLESTAANLVFSIDGSTSLPFVDDEDTAIGITVTSTAKAIRLRAGDYPILTPWIGLTVGTEVDAEAGRQFYLLLRKA